jgi:uncharacterized membrane protein YtjA (UPF0391 family)
MLDWTVITAEFPTLLCFPGVPGGAATIRKILAYRAAHE